MRVLLSPQTTLLCWSRFEGKIDPLKNPFSAAASTSIGRQQLSRKKKEDKSCAQTIDQLAQLSTAQWDQSMGLLKGFVLSSVPPSSQLSHVQISVS